MKLKKWKLVDKKDVSPSKYFPLEIRTYKLPNGATVDDFYVTTLADSVHVIPITKDGKIILIRMYKQGVDEIVIQTPAGRLESKHKNIKDVAVRELEEETGIKVQTNQLIRVGKAALGTTKASEVVHYFTVTNVEFNSRQKLDENEEIEIISLTPDEIDQAILNGTIWCGPTITGWHFLKSRFPNLLKAY